MRDLDDANLGEYKSKFAIVGIKSSVDLAEADDDDLAEVGLSKLARNKK